MNWEFPLRIPVGKFDLGATLRPGDYLVALLGLLLVASLAHVAWNGGRGTTVVIRSGGKIVVEADLARDHQYEVRGPLGTTVVRVERGRARIARDPSPRQYCVKQGWLTRAGEAALCLPNQVGIELAGADKGYDSLSY